MKKKKTLEETDIVVRTQQAHNVDNIDSTLIQCHNVESTLCGTRCWKNVDSMLIQRQDGPL